MTGRRMAAQALVQDSLVWDNIWPLEPEVGNDLHRLAGFQAAGYDVISLTIAGDNHTSGQAFNRVATARRRIQVEIAGDLDIRGFFDADPAVRSGFQSVKIRVAIDSDASQDQLARVLAAADRGCPMLDTCRGATPVTIELAQ